MNTSVTSGIFTMCGGRAVNGVCERCGAMVESTAGICSRAIPYDDPLQAELIRLRKIEAKAREIAALPYPARTLEAREILAAGESDES